MTAFRQVVIEHFRHPRNRGPLDGANGAAEGVNALCGDRIRMQVRIEGGSLADARFVADACAICIASASLLTERVRGMSLDDVVAMCVDDVHRLLEGEPPRARRKCAALPLDTLHRALEAAS